MKWEAGAEEDLGRAFQVGALRASLLGVKLGQCIWLEGLPRGCWDLGL